MLSIFQKKLPTEIVFPNIHPWYIPGVVAALNVAMEEADRTLVKTLMRNYMMDRGSSEGKVILESGNLWI